MHFRTESIENFMYEGQQNMSSKNMSFEHKVSDRLIIFKK